MKYIPPADLRPETIEALTPRTKWTIQQQIAEGTLKNQESYALDVTVYQTEK